ncbi:MAG TPA: class I SAM-dependent methyltransferase [Ktedonobacteraceae bacterium]|nr:class I SAM-dependent methyltransferase [Ktedonobacteraceae bacterium]
MATSSDVPEPTSSYQVDAENVAEMARLVRQARLLSEHLGLLPADLQLEQKHAILDIGCGPGEWVLEIAQSLPESQVIGVDISERMIAYAQYCALDHGISNVQFLVMDARQPFSFPDASFDVIHARFITGFLATATWPVLLRECFRLLRPGGTICNAEFEELGITTSPALAQYNHLLIKAARRAGQCFAPEGDYYGITAVQARLLQEAGFQHIRQQAHVMNYSAGMLAHNEMYNNFSTFLNLVQPFLVRSGVTTQENIEILYARTMEEMQDGGFCAVAFFQSVWGSKPKEDNE